MPRCGAVTNGPNQPVHSPGPCGGWLLISAELASISTLAVNQAVNSAPSPCAAHRSIARDAGDKRVQKVVTGVTAVTRNTTTHPLTQRSGFFISYDTTLSPTRAL